MAPSEERQKELEDASIMVYQQISAGYSMEQIRAQFYKTSLATDEITWILETGKQRYIGYRVYLKHENRAYARSFMFSGFALIAIVIVAAAVMGWPTAGYRSGQLVFAFLFGCGAILYGAWQWTTANPSGTRTDLHDL